MIPSSLQVDRCRAIRRVGRQGLDLRSWQVAAGLLLLSVLFPAPAAAESQLQALAESMQVGQFAELETNGLTYSLLAHGEQHIMQYASKAGWDPVRGEFNFFGKGHIVAGGKHIRYTEATNSWTLLPSVPPSVQGNEWGYHAYDFNASDPDTGNTYFRGRENSFDIYRRATQTWSALPPSPATATQVAGSLDYFPEVGGMVWIDYRAGLWLYRTATNDWEQIAPRETFSAMGQYHNWGTYEPVHGIALFGGGNDSRAMWKMDANKQVTRLADSPAELGSASTAEFPNTETGNMIVFLAQTVSYGGTGYNIWEYVVDTDSWRGIGNHSLHGIGIHQGPVLATIPEYGVAFMFDEPLDPRVYLYKYADVAGGPDTRAPTRMDGAPGGPLPAGTTSVSMTLSTDEAATCRYSTGPGLVFDNMPHAFSTTGGAGHATTISGLTDGGSYDYYVRCRDEAGNANVDDYGIAFSVVDPSVNHAPQQDTPVANRTGFEHQSIQFDIAGNFSDPDPYDSLSFSLGGGSLPPGLTLNAAGVVQGTIAEGAAANSPYTGIVIRATDNGAEPMFVDGAPFDWTISPASTTSVEDFDALCAHPDVVFCYGFDDPVDAANYINSPTCGAPGCGNDALCEGNRCAKTVTDMAVSGDRSLRFEIPGGSTASFGDFEHNFTPESGNRGNGPYPVQFGEGEEFYVRWRQRFTPEALIEYQANSGGDTGFKQIIVGEGDRPGEPTYSCTELETVFRQVPAYGGPFLYHSCGNWANLEFWDGVQVRKQHQGPPYCYYPDDPDGGCVRYFPNEWMTFQFHIKVGQFNQVDPDSLFQAWVAREGQPSILVYDSRISNPEGWKWFNANPDAKFGKVWLLPYITDKSAAHQHETGYTWYDNLIISRSRVPDPAVTGGEDPPPAPTGLAVD